MDIYDQAVTKWGHESQINMMIEECAELITALRHFARGKATIDDVCSELADIEIMSAQMRSCFGNKKIEAAIELKIMRLKQLLDD